ncbi:MAG: DUF2911 domain-containing protein [Vicingaceae bacterium]
MKRISLLLCSLFVLSTAAIAQNDKSERKSPPATAEGKVGSAKITIDYSSPAVNDREIYGGLVPYDKIWRAGANEATTFETSTDLKVNGESLPAGKYAFFVIPKAEGNWTVIFNTEHKQWGAYKHDESKDALRVEAKTATIDPVENLTYSIQNGQLILDWATTRMMLKLEE